jgi:hypothetical protein
MLHYFCPKFSSTHEQAQAAVSRRRWYTHQSKPPFALLAPRPTIQEGQKKMLQKTQRRQALQELPQALKALKGRNMLAWGIAPWIWASPFDIGNRPMKSGIAI